MSTLTTVSRFRVRAYSTSVPLLRSMDGDEAFRGRGDRSALLLEIKVTSSCHDKRCLYGSFDEAEWSPELNRLRCVSCGLQGRRAPELKSLCSVLVFLLLKYVYNLPEFLL